MAKMEYCGHPKELLAQIAKLEEKSNQIMTNNTTQPQVTSDAQHPLDQDGDGGDGGSPMNPLGSVRRRAKPARRRVTRYGDSAERGL